MWNKNVGPSQVELGGTSLGLIKDGVNLIIEQSTFDETADVTGENPRNTYITGTRVEAEFAITSASMAELAAILDETITSGTTIDELVLSANVGKQLTKQICIIKPITDGTVSTDVTEWTYIPSATIVPEIQAVSNTGDQKLWNCRIKGNPVTSDDLGSGGHLNGTDYTEGTVIRFGDAD